MVSWNGPRRPRWSYRLLDSSDRDLGALEGVSGGSVELNAASRLGGHGTLKIRETRQEIDWMQHRVQVIYDPGIPGAEPWHVATHMLSSPVASRSATGGMFTVETLPKTAVVDEDAVGDTFSLPAGTQVIPKVVELIQSTGESRIAVSPSEAELRNPLVWTAGTSKLSIVNELLKAAGYWSLWCDGAGMFRVEPYLLPANRPVSFVFAAGAASIHRPEWSREQNLSSVPNRFVVVGMGTGDAPPPSGVAEITDPDSPFSFQARGRWITRVEEGVEGDSQAVFDELAQRRLRDATSPVGRLKVTHAIAPLTPNAVVGFEPTGAAPRLATVQSMRIPLLYNAQCQAEWREI